MNCYIVYTMWIAEDALIMYRLVRKLVSPWKYLMFAILELLNVQYHKLEYCIQIYHFSLTEGTRHPSMVASMELCTFKSSTTN